MESCHLDFFLRTAQMCPLVQPRCALAQPRYALVQPSLKFFSPRILTFQKIQKKSGKSDGGKTRLRDFRRITKQICLEKSLPQEPTRASRLNNNYVFTSKFHVFFLTCLRQTEICPDSDKNYTSAALPRIFHMILYGIHMILHDFYKKI